LWGLGGVLSARRKALSMRWRASWSLNVSTGGSLVMVTGKIESTLPKVSAQLSAVIARDGPLPEEHFFYSLIGRAVAEWARLEHELDRTIWDLAACDPNDPKRAISSCMTGKIVNFAFRFDAIEDLADLRGFDEQMKRRIRKLKSRAGDYVNKRNRYVHNAWFARSIGDDVDDVISVGQFISFSVKNKTFGHIIITKTEMTNFIHEVQLCIEDIANLRADLQRNLSPSP
jgi:hypothetical protein